MSDKFSAATQALFSAIGVQLQKPAAERQDVIDSARLQQIRDLKAEIVTLETIAARRRADLNALVLAALMESNADPQSSIDELTGKITPHPAR